MPKTLTVGDILNCAKCEAHFSDNPETLIAASASVGIKHGKSGARILREYLASYHLRGHRSI